MVNTSHMKDGFSLLGICLAVAAVTKQVNEFLFGLLGSTGSVLAWILSFISLIGLFLFAISEFWLAFTKK